MGVKSNFLSVAQTTAKRTGSDAWVVADFKQEQALKIRNVELFPSVLSEQPELLVDPTERPSHVLEYPSLHD